MPTKETKPAPAPRPTTTSSDLQGMLEKYKNQIKSVIPKHVTPERMIRLALTAFHRTPLLAKCSAQSISGALVQASILGLEPDGLSGECFLIPYWNAKVGGYECQMQAGYKGIVKLAHNTREYKSIDAQAVHDNDFFEFQKGMVTDCVHKWKPREERGGVYGYWGGYALKDGGGNFEFMSVAEIDKHRDQYSQGAYKRERGQLVLDAQGQKILIGPWKDSPHWMYCKTPLMQALKLAPKSYNLAAALALTEQSTAGLKQQFMMEVPVELNPGLTDDTVDEIPEPKALADGKPNGSPGFISETQVKRLEQIAEETGWRAADLAAYLKKEYAITSVHQLPAKDFDHVIEIVRTGGNPD